MSLLLDALNRASKDKATAATLAEVTASKLGKPAPALPDMAPNTDWPTLGLSMTDFPPPSFQPAGLPGASSAMARADSSMQLEAKPQQTQQTPVPPPPSPPETRAKPVAPISTPTPTPQTKLEQRPAAPAGTFVPNSAPHVAQSIMRAQAPNPKTGQPKRLIALIGVAVLLAGGLGSVMLGWWGQSVASLVTSPPQGPAIQPVVMAPALEPATAPQTELPMASPQAAPAVTSQVQLQKPQNPPIAVKPLPIPRVAAVAPQTGSRPYQCAPGLTLAECQAASRPKPVAAPTKSDQAILQSRRSGSSALEQGYAALTQGRLTEATQAYTQALVGNPEERDALLGLAYIAHRQGRADDARAYYKRVLRQEPDNPVAKTGLLTLSPAEDAQELGSRFREVAEQSPDSAAAQSALGHALVRQGRLADAQLAFNRAQMLEPSVALHAFNLAVALDRLRNYGPARLYYERAMTLSTQAGGERASGVPQAVVRARLEQLQAANL